MLSLSVRIAEGFLSKEEATLPLNELAQLAIDAKYGGVCMRASQVGVASTPDELCNARQILDDAGLKVTMVTADFDIVYNNDRGPNCLQNIGPYLDVATRLGASMIRVALKRDEDIPHAQRAADQAKDRDIRLVHQCHTLSLFETVDGAVKSLKAIDRPNFGIIYEPANLEICGQDYGVESIQRLSPWMFNVYFQNQKLREGGAITLDTWVRGPVSFDLCSVHDAGGINFDRVFHGLGAAGYEGPITVHQSARDGETPLESASKTAAFLREQYNCR